MRGEHESFPVEVYTPWVGRKVPVIVMLHGSAGAFSLSQDGHIPTRDNFGEHTLASNCFLVVLPHYLESVGLRDVNSREEIAKLAPALLDAVRVAVSYGSRLPMANASEMGLYGESLGGFLAVRIAMESSEVRAVSVVGTGVPNGLDIRNRRWNALLIQHGAVDDIVPVQEAHKLAKLADDSGIQTELKVYADVGHYPDPASSALILKTTLCFFRRVLW